MSGVQSKYGGEVRRPTGGERRDYLSVLPLKTYRPTGERLERGENDGQHLWEMPPKSQPEFYMHGHQILPLVPLHHRSPILQDERKLPGLPLDDSDTLPVRWRQEAMPEKKEIFDSSHSYRQQMSNVAKVHFRRSAEYSRRSLEGVDDHDEETGSWSGGSSLGGSLTIAERRESKPDHRNRALSDSFDMIEHEGAESGDEDEYVHVPRYLPRKGESFD